MEYTEKQILDELTQSWQNGRFKVLASEWNDSPAIINTLLKLNRHPDPKTAWRSAYLLDLIHDLNSACLDNHLDLLIDEALTVTNDSIRRHYLRILERHDLGDRAGGEFVDACFRWLASADTPIAVKVYAMSILYQLTILYPDLSNELKIALEELLPWCSKGEANRALKILKKLKA